MIHICYFIQSEYFFLYIGYGDFDRQSKIKPEPYFDSFARNSFAERKIIFVTGGDINGIGADYLSNTEIVIVGDDNFVCYTPASLPDPNFGGVTLKTSQGHPLVCGGDTLGDECLEYDPQAFTWVPGPTMGAVRFWASAAQISDGAFLVVGGYADDGTTEIYRNGDFTPGPHLPHLFPGGKYVFVEILILQHTWGHGREPQWAPPLRLPTMPSSERGGKVGYGSQRGYDHLWGGGGTEKRPFSTVL